MAKMFRLLRADEIDARVSTINKNGLTLLLYKDARCDQNILDDTVGPDKWQRKHELINGNLFCSVGIWFNRGDVDGYGEWVWKQDVGTESYTEKEKGQASDAFKRACFNWGVGRELYTAPFIWIPAGRYNEYPGKNSKPTTYDRFKVTKIGYDSNENINYLEIVNTSMKNRVVYTYGDRPPKSGSSSPGSAPTVPNNTPTETVDRRIGDKQALQLKEICVKHQMPMEKALDLFKRKSFEEITFADLHKYAEQFQKLLDDWDVQQQEEKTDESTGAA